MPIKIAMIGAGSIGFTRKLMHDILAVPELADTHFAFMDINASNLEMVMQLAQRDIDANGLPAAITPTTDRREAITDADYVISVVRQGGLDAFQLDIDIPLKYGIDQCVGDTICAGASCTVSAPSRRCWTSAPTSVRSPSRMPYSSTIRIRWR